MGGSWADATRGIKRTGILSLGVMCMKKGVDGGDTEKRKYPNFLWFVYLQPF